jgi:hypothetical protein
MRTFLCFLAASILAYADESSARLSVPMMGYVFDNNAKAIRLISGVPGAAGLDGVIAIDTGIDSAFVQSRARVAIANTKESGVALIQWNGSPRLVSLGTALSRVTQVAFSSSGDRVAISNGAAVEVWSGLTGDAAQTATFVPDGGVAALAIKADGTVAAATRGGSILMLTDGARTLASGGDWTALAFLPDGSLLAADGASQNLLLIQDGGDSSVVLHIDQKPLALAASVDGTQAAVATVNSITLVRLDSGAAGSVTCNCQASRFEPLAGNLVLQFVDARSGSLFILDADGADARIMTLLELNGGAAR